MAEDRGFAEGTFASGFNRCIRFEERSVGQCAL
jgi:hypothetical protein